MTSKVTDGKLIVLHLTRDLRCSCLLPRCMPLNSQIVRDVIRIGPSSQATDYGRLAVLACSLNEWSSVGERRQYIIISRYLVLTWSGLYVRGPGGQLLLPLLSTTPRKGQRSVAMVGTLTSKSPSSAFFIYSLMRHRRLGD